MENDALLYFIPPNQKGVYIAGGADHLKKAAIALPGGEYMHPGTNLALAYYDYSAILVYQTSNQSQLFSEPIDLDDDVSPRIGRIPVGPVGE